MHLVSQPFPISHHNLVLSTFSPPTGTILRCAALLRSYNDVTIRHHTEGQKQCAGVEYLYDLFSSCSGVNEPRNQPYCQKRTLDNSEKPSVICIIFSSDASISHSSISAHGNYSMGKLQKIVVVAHYVPHWHWKLALDIKCEVQLRGCNSWAHWAAKNRSMYCHATLAQHNPPYGTLPK